MTSGFVPGGLAAGRAPRTFMMYEGTVRKLSLEDRLAATQLAGCSQLSVTPLDWTRWISEGMSSRDMRLMAADHGVTLAHLDPFCRWLDNWRPGSLDGSRLPLPFFSFDIDDFLRIAEAIGATSMTAMTVAPVGSSTVDAMTEGFAMTCDRAANAGLVCELEFIPLGWAVPDLATAWQIVQAADRPNAGMVFDMWHFVRSGSTLDELRLVPGEHITSVQLSDGDLDLPDDRSVMEDCLFHRRPLGEGTFPVTQILQTLADIGALTRVGPEYFSSEFDGLSADVIGRRCADSMESIRSG